MFVLSACAAAGLVTGRGGDRRRSRFLSVLLETGAPQEREIQGKMAPYPIYSRVLVNTGHVNESNIIVLRALSPTCRVSEVSGCGIWSATERNVRGLRGLDSVKSRAVYRILHGEKKTKKNVQENAIAIY